MDFFEAATAIIIVGIVFSFVLMVVKMAFTHLERMQRIKHGYPLTDERPKDTPKDKEFIDYSDRRN